MHNENYYNKPTNKEIIDNAIEQWKQISNVELWKERVTHIEDNHVRLCTTVMLENQKIYNQTANFSSETSELLYDVILNVFPNLIIHKLISVQPMIGPTGVAYKQNFEYEKDKDGNIINDVHQIMQKINGIEIETEVTQWTSPRIISPVSTFELTAKSKIVRLPLLIRDNFDQICKDFKTKIEGEILKDLWNNCKTVASYEDTDVKYVQYVPAVSAVLHRKTLEFDKYWIVINRKVYNQYKEIFNNFNTCYGLYSGCVYVVDHWENEGVLMGVYANQFWRKKYAWCPYILICPLEVRDDVQQIITRYDKKLEQAGAKSFAKILRKSTNAEEVLSSKQQSTSV